MSFFDKLKSGIQSIVPGRELARGIGYSLAMPEISKWQTESDKREDELRKEIAKRIKEARASNDTERLDRLKKAAGHFGRESIIEAAIADAPTTRQVIASAGELAAFATLGLKPKLPYKPFRLTLPFTKGAAAIKGARAGLSAVRAAELAKAGIGKKILGRIVKPLAREAGIGAGLFGLMKASEKEATTNDIIKAAETGAVFGAGLFGGLAGLGYGAKGVSRVVGPPLKKLFQKAEIGLEKTAAGVKEEIGTQIQKTLSFIKEPTGLKAKTAQVLLKGLTEARKLEARLIDRFLPLKRIENRVAEFYGRPLKESEKVYRDARLLQSVANADAEAKVIQLTEKLKPYGDIRDQSKAWLAQIDFIDRAKLGQKVPGGQSYDELVAGLNKMKDEIGPENMKRVGEVRKAIGDYNQRLLQERLGAGLINQETIDNLLRTHPNYIPHNVIMEVDEKIAQGLSQSLNVSKTDIMKAVGSVKNIDDPFVATIERTPIATRVIEKNKLLNNIIKVQEESNLFPGMKPLQTAETVTRRKEIFVELKLLKKELGDKIRQLRASKKFDIRLSGKIRTLEGEIAKLEKLTATEISGFFREGELTEKLIEGTATTRTIPTRLEGLASVARKTDSLESFSNNFDVMRAFESGELERAGFSSIEELFNVANKPFKKTVDKTVEKVITGKLGKAKKLFGGSEELRDKRGILETIDKLSIEDSLSFLNKSIDDIKGLRKELYLESLQLAKGKKVLGEETINFFRKGIEEIWVVPEDIAVAIKNLDSPLMPTWFKVATFPQRVLKKFATQYNLSFAIPNKFRDKQTAALTSNAFIKGLSEKYGTIEAIKGLGSKEIKDLYTKSGGYGASIFREGEDVIWNKLNKTGTASKLQWANPAKIIDEINSGIETSTRMEVFKKALASGLSPKDAALASRDVTIDFAKMGTWMKPLNQAIPFLNARVQGFVNLPRAIASSPEAFARMQMYTAAYPSILLHQHNRRFDSYKNVSQYFKNKYWIVMIGETDSIDNYTGQPIKVPQFVTIPKGEGQALVAGPIQYYLEKSDGVDYRKTSEMIADVVGSASPMEFQSFDQGNAWLSLAGQFGPGVSIPVGLAANKQPYFGSPIVPEKRVNAPKEQQFKTSTPETTKELANLMNVSPAKLEFILDSFGGLTQDMQSAADIVYNVVRGDGIGGNPITDTPIGAATQIPIARRFVREGREFYGPEMEYRQEQKQKLETDITGQKLKVEDKATEIWEELNKKKTGEERLNYLNSLGDELTPFIREKINNWQKSRQTVEVLKKSDPVELRARYIHQRLEEIKDGEERVNFLESLEDSKILTDDVRLRIRELQSQ